MMYKCRHCGAAFSNLSHRRACEDHCVLLRQFKPSPPKRKLSEDVNPKIISFVLGFLFGLSMLGCGHFLLSML